jgi:hypothetical protein
MWDIQASELTSRHNLTEATRDMVKKSTDDVKKLAAYPSGAQHASSFLPPFLHTHIPFYNP